MADDFFPVKDGVVLWNDARVPLPRLYANVLDDIPIETWDFANIEIHWSSPHGIELIKKIGRGKYSEVFHAIMTNDDGSESDVVVKILKPVKKRKIRREICILNYLNGAPNVLTLIDVVKDPISRTPSLVTEYINMPDFKKLYQSFTDHDIRYYMFQLLVALDYCNSRGIMHRDVKPHNIMIDPSKRKLRLIDWGLSDFYQPGRKYNVRVASRYYKAPELLTNFGIYSYSVDMWSVGCIMGSMYLKREPFFCGRDNVDQLVQIVNVLGSDEFLTYMRKYRLVLPAGIEHDKVLNIKRVPLQSFVSARTTGQVPADALTFIEGLLRYDPEERPLPAEALRHSYFDPVRETCMEALKSSASAPRKIE